MKVDSVVVELIDICNLNCAYCLRDEAALHGKAHFLKVANLARILGEVKALGTSSEIQFTGGEPTLHPEFRAVLKTAHDLDLRFTVITNGWTFSRVLPAFLEFRRSLSAVLLSIDGVNRDDHDLVRGKGSFDRLMRAVMSCRQHELPFGFKVTIDRRKAPQLRQFGDFSARLGAICLQLAPLLPTSPAFAKDVLDVDEQREFLREVQQLKSVVRLSVDLAAGFFDPRPGPTCGPLLGRALNIDYGGRLVFCTILAGFRGQTKHADVISDLKQATVKSALPALRSMVAAHNGRRHAAFAAFDADPGRVPLRLGSNCIDCLCSFEKMQGDFLETPRTEGPMDDQLSFEVPDSIIASDFSGKEGLVLDTRTQRYHTLNETAIFLWLAAEKGNTVGQMTDSLCATFAVDRERARQSVVAALTSLQSNALIAPRRTGETSGPAGGETRS